MREFWCWVTPRWRFWAWYEGVGTWSPVLGGWKARVRWGEPWPKVLVYPDPGVAGMPPPGVSLTNMEPLLGSSGTWWEPSPEALRPAGVPSLFLLRRQLPLPGPFLTGAGVEVAGRASGVASSFSSMLIRISWGCLAAELTAWKPRPIAGDGDLVCELSPSIPTACLAADVTET